MLAFNLPPGAALIPLKLFHTVRFIYSGCNSLLCQHRVHGYHYSSCQLNMHLQSNLHFMAGLVIDGRWSQYNP